MQNGGQGREQDVVVFMLFATNESAMTVPFSVRLLMTDNDAYLKPVMLMEQAVLGGGAGYGSIFPPLPWLSAENTLLPGYQVWIALDEDDQLQGYAVAHRAFEKAAAHLIQLCLPDDLDERWVWGQRLVVRVVSALPSICLTLPNGCAASTISFFEEMGFVSDSGREGMHYQPGYPISGLQLSSDGWIDAARHVASPNADERPQEQSASLLVIHNISLPPYRYGGDAVQQLFTNQLDPDKDPFYQQIHTLRVSSHLFIRRSGELVQFVPLSKRAWHAGVSSWNGRERCNDFSIGVELEGCDFEPFTDAQYHMLQAVAWLLREQLGITAVSGHEHIAPGRKTDPGPFFDWSKVGDILTWSK